MSKWTKKMIAISLVILLGLSYVLYGYYWSKFHFQIVFKEVQTTKISSSLNNHTVLFFSDLLYCDENIELVEKAINKIKNYPTDSVVFLGDLYKKDENVSEENNQKLIELLSSIKGKYGKYAILGEQDTNENIVNTYVSSGFEVISNGIVNVSHNNNDNFQLVGLNYLNKDNKGIEEVIDPNKFTMLISHAPDIKNYVDSTKYDLIISGHTHANNINFPMFGPLKKIEGNQQFNQSKGNLTVVNGVSNDKYTFRYNNRPQIVIYRLVLKK
ncbi:MAG: metallophosphoesterase [Erysipelotrichaceae bacterium]